MKPEIGLILGSGLGNFADELQGSISVPASDIPAYPRSSVAGHAGRVVVGHLSGTGRKAPLVVAFQGRTHFYETGILDPVLFPTYLAKALGVHTLIVTNAAGGIRKSLRPGDLMLINDVINLTFLPLQQTPDRIRNHRGLLDPILRDQFLKTAKDEKMALAEGTYCWVKGPSYETAAEIEMLARIGADAVGMSTVPELTHALSLGLRTAGLSLISNLATGIGDVKLSHAEVTETASRVRQHFSRLLTQTLLSLTPPG